MVGFGGYQGKALYWRNNCAEYGRQSAFPLSLEPGNYKLTYAMAAWKESPSYKVSIVNASTGSILASSSAINASPNANGNTSANLSSTILRELDFTVETKAKYVIRFADATTTGGYHEYLLLECSLARVQDTPTKTIDAIDTADGEVKEVYDLQGRRTSTRTVGKGLRIIRTSDGKTIKVLN